MSEDGKNSPADGRSGEGDSPKPHRWLLTEQRKNLTSDPGPLQAPPTAQFKPTQGDTGAMEASGGQGGAGSSSETSGPGEGLTESSDP